MCVCVSACVSVYLSVCFHTKTFAPEHSDLGFTLILYWHQETALHFRAHNTQWVTSVLLRSRQPAASSLLASFFIKAEYGSAIGPLRSRVYRSGKAGFIEEKPAQRLNDTGTERVHKNQSPSIRDQHSPGGEAWKDSIAST